jgi:hypothetical protein
MPSLFPSTHPCELPFRCGEFVEANQSDGISNLSAKNLSAFPNFYLPLTQITSIFPNIPSHSEGRCATSTARVGERWTRMAPLTKAPDAYGEYVWS